MAASLPSSRVAAIRRRLLDHYDRERRDLPWRGETDPYRVWVSEVILQQTRVETAIPFYRSWLERFPTLEALAASDPEGVMAAWSGLGYYRRARHLHRAALMVRDQLGGELPTEANLLQELPGIGPYTAGALASIAFGRREPAVDGNARRVLSRLFDLERPSATGLRRLAGALVPPDRPGDFNQALMELGATVCRPRRPRCAECPLARLCLASRRGTVMARPGAPRNRAVPEREVGTAVLLSARRRVLLARRPDEGLLGGMWEFPGAVAHDRERPAAAARRAAAALLGPNGLPPRRAPARPIAVIPQAFSHRRHVYHAFLLGLPDEPPFLLPVASGTTPEAPEWTAAEWVAVEGLVPLGERALPSAQRRIARAVLAAPREWA
ncbi:MAG: A/G-specific adenine glycosylase [Gemmatimonadota bacterium]